ncbi:hypothetical protein [Flavobacterium pectinovorum]|uniref:hypothetical protein n=1 Tax=Flavobacterium pectinovorum TaxID=29533 RepID=UPI0013762292|nr:hypothetical protein [Flavobacterium pectinovorum]
MSRTKKVFLAACIIMLIIHIVSYFFYNRDIVQASMGVITMIFIIMSIIMNKESET